MVCSPLPGCFSAPPQIVSLSPSRGATSVPADSPVTVVFDQPLDLASVSGRFLVSPPLPGCGPMTALESRPAGACRIRPLPSGDGFRFEHPGVVFAPGATYTFTVAAGIRDRTGIANSLTHHWSLTVAAAPAIVSSSPDDGDGGVPADSALVVSFSRPMEPVATASAITLDPPVPGTRVERNRLDHARFVVLPGQLLRPLAAYRLAVAASATDEHGQRLERPYQARFHAAGLSRRDHAVVVAAAPGGPAATVVLASVSVLEPGDPGPASTVLTAPRCEQISCGLVGSGAELEEYRGVALSPDGHLLAVVARDLTSPEHPVALRVLDLVLRRLLLALPGAGLPSWSPDGRLLGFSRAGDVDLLSSADNTVRSLPSGDPARAPLVWAPDGALAALPVSQRAHPQAIELISPGLAARFPLPGLSRGGAQVAFSRDSRRVAIGSGGGAFLLDLANGERTSLHAELEPLGFAADGSLFGIERGADHPPRLLRLDPAGEVLGTLAVAPAARLDSLAVSSTGRVLAYLAGVPSGAVRVEVQSMSGNSRLALGPLPPGLQAVEVSLN